MNAYRAAAVRVLTVDRIKNGAYKVTLNLLEPERVTPPLAPASLVPLSGDWRVILELHRVLEGSGDRWILATSDQRTPMPEPGSELGLQTWWTADVLEIVTDTSRRWVEAPLDDTAQDFCPLCWSSREVGDRAYTDGHEWICPACHGKYLLDDYLGVRLGEAPLKRPPE